MSRKWINVKRRLWLQSSGWSFGDLGFRGIFKRDSMDCIALPILSSSEAELFSKQQQTLHDNLNSIKFIKNCRFKDILKLYHKLNISWSHLSIQYYSLIPQDTLRNRQIIIDIYNLIEMTFLFLWNTMNDVNNKAHHFLHFQNLISWVAFGCCVTLG